MRTITFVLICAALCAVSGKSYAAEYPSMEGNWIGSVRTVSMGEQVRDQVARGGALIEEVELTFSVSYQDREVFIGESKSNAADAQAIPVWGAIRSTGKEAVFVTADGGRGQIWFSSPTTFEYCFANNTPAQMSSHCAVLEKR